MFAKRNMLTTKTVQELAALLGEKLTQAGLVATTAESCTGGLTASRITDIPGSSAIFLGSLVTYSNDAKSNILGVKQQTINKFGAVSEETVQEMAIGVRDKIGSDLAIAFSGVAGPGGGTKNKPVGVRESCLLPPLQKGRESSMDSQTTNSQLEGHV